MVVMDNDGYDMLKLQSNATAKVEPTTLSNMDLPKMKMMVGKLINTKQYMLRLCSRISRFLSPSKVLLGSEYGQTTRNDQTKYIA